MLALNLITPGWCLVALWTCIALAVGCWFGFVFETLRDDEGEFDYIERHREQMRALTPAPGEGR
jgi:hypothetical protein